MEVRPTRLAFLMYSSRLPVVKMVHAARGTLVVAQTPGVQVPGEGLGHLPGGVQQVQGGVQAADVVLHQGIVGAAQHAALDLVHVHQAVQTGADLGVDGGLGGGIAHVLFHQVGQVGAAVAEHLALRGLLVDQVGIAARLGGEAGGDDAHPLIGRGGHGVRPAWTTLRTGQRISSRYWSMRQEMVLQATRRAFTLWLSIKRSI